MSAAADFIIIKYYSLYVDMQALPTFYREYTDTAMEQDAFMDQHSYMTFNYHGNDHHPPQIQMDEQLIRNIQGIALFWYFYEDADLNLHLRDFHFLICKEERPITIYYSKKWTERARRASTVHSWEY